MKRSAFIAVVALGVLLIAALSIRILKRRSSVEDSRIAKVSWTVSGKPMTVRASVTDTLGHPLRNYEVHIDNNSGGNSATTDELGVALIELGEREMAGVSINGVRIVDPSYGHNVDRGLEMTILIKDTNAFRRNEKL